MMFPELCELIDGKYILCENYEQRNAFVDYFRDNGVETDSVMKRDMAAGGDRWLYPIFDPDDNEIHATSAKPLGDYIRYADIESFLSGVAEIDLPELSHLLV